MDYRCLQCHAKNFGRLIRKSNIPAEDKRARMQWFYRYLSSVDESTIAPKVSTEIFRYFREQQLDGNPYVKEKEQFNKALLSKYAGLKSDIEASPDPFDRAMRYALAGNIIDFGPHTTIPLDETFTKVLETALAIDHSAMFREDLAKAKRILWLGDNAGEIVMDKLFIESLGIENVTFAVRGVPVINDATTEDAEFIGLHHVARVISNGNDAPSTLLDECSDEFRKAFFEADVIISKGQGNYEGLMEHQTKRIYFMLMAKCFVIAEKLDVAKGSFIVMCNQNQNVENSHS